MAEHKRIQPLVMWYPWISRCWVEAKARKANTIRKAKANVGKAKATRDEKDNDEDKKANGKCKANTKATEYFAGYCLLCKAWRHMKEDCW